MKEELAAFVGSRMPASLTPAQKVEYKKSLAKMMVIWTISTHPKWKERLLTRQFNFWKTDLPIIASTFPNDQEREEVLDRIRLVAQGVQSALESLNSAAGKEWVEERTGDPDCPADEALDLMFQAFAAKVGT